MYEKRFTAVVRQGRLEPQQPLEMPDGCSVDVSLRLVDPKVEERRLLIRELHELMRTNPFLDSVTGHPDLEW